MLTLLLADVVFSSEALAVVSALLASTVAALVTLWRVVAVGHADTLRDIRFERDRLLEIVLTHGLRGCLPADLARRLGPFPDDPSGDSSPQDQG